MRASAVFLNNSSSDANVKRNAVITVNGSTLKTTGNDADAIWNTREGGMGDSRTDVRNSTITTTGLLAHGIFGYHSVSTGIGDVDIDVRNTTITTESTDLDPDFLDTFSVGIRGRHDGIGDIRIDAWGGSVTTKGTYSYGIYGDHHGDGAVMIETHPGHTVTTTGPNGHGIVAYQRSTTADPRIIEVTVGGSVDTSGAGALRRSGGHA